MGSLTRAYLTKSQPTKSLWSWSRTTRSICYLPHLIVPSKSLNGKFSRSLPGGGRTNVMEGVNLRRCMTTSSGDVGMSLNQADYTNNAFDCLVNVLTLADQYQVPQIESELLLKSILDSGKESLGYHIFTKCGLNVENSLIPALESYLSQQPKVTSQTSMNRPMGPVFGTVLRKANGFRTSLKDDFISSNLINQNLDLLLAFAKWDTQKDTYRVEHLLVSLAEFDSRFLNPYLKKHGITSKDLEAVLKTIRGSRRVDTKNSEESYNCLEKYGTNLTQKAIKGDLDPVIGRDDAIRRVIQILSRRTKNNPVILGDPGVGKTAIAEGLAQRIVSGDVPDPLKGRTVISLDMGALIAGAKFRGEFEDRLKSVLKEVQGSNGQIILFIDEIHTVVGAGAGGGDSSLDAGNILKPMLARGELRCIGATTTAEYRKYIEKDRALERRLQQVFLDEPSVSDTISILRGLKEKYEKHHNVRIRDSALVAAAEMSERYIGDRYLPDKAIDLIDEAASRMRIEIESKPAVLDQISRTLLKLEMEKISIESDLSSRHQIKSDIDIEKGRLLEIEKQIANLKEEQSRLNAKWEAEISTINEHRELKDKLETLKLDQEKAEREYDLTKAAQIRYGDIPEIEKKIKDKEMTMTSTGVSRLLRDEITTEDIAEIVSQWTGVPIRKLVAQEKEKLLHLKDALSARVVGQEAGVNAVTEAIYRSRAGLSDPNRPISCLVFLGPTGVGKTELCRALASQLFDSEDAVIRIDMSEYMERHAVSRLVGAPPGYVGYDQGGQLSEAVRRKPYSVVLFDEMEKAHPEVFNIFLQILEDGRLTDSKGMTISFKNCIIIFTSNIGSEYYMEKGKMGHLSTTEFSGIKKKIFESVKSILRPEFVNRIDEFVVFNSLSEKEYKQIVKLEIDKLNSRLTKRRPPVTLSVQSDLIDHLAAISYDPQYGARPIRRQIRKSLETPLATLLLEKADVEQVPTYRVEASLNPGSKIGVITDNDITLNIFPAS